MPPTSPSPAPGRGPKCSHGARSRDPRPNHLCLGGPATIPAATSRPPSPNAGLPTHASVGKPRSRRADPLDRAARRRASPTPDKCQHPAAKDRWPCGEGTRSEASRRYGPLVAAPRAKGPRSHVPIRAEARGASLPSGVKSDGYGCRLRSEHVRPRRAEWPEGHVDAVGRGEPVSRWVEGHRPRAAGVALLQHQWIGSRGSREIEQHYPPGSRARRLAREPTGRVASYPSADHGSPGTCRTRSGCVDRAAVGQIRISPDPVAGRDAGASGLIATVHDVGLMLHDQAGRRAPVFERSTVDLPAHRIGQRACRCRRRSEPDRPPSTRRVVARRTEAASERTSDLRAHGGHRQEARPFPRRARRREDRRPIWARAAARGRRGIDQTRMSPHPIGHEDVAAGSEPDEDARPPARPIIAEQPAASRRRDGGPPPSDGPPRRPTRRSG